MNQLSISSQEIVDLSGQYHFFLARTLVDFTGIIVYSDPPSIGANPFSSMGDITVDPKGVAKLLDGLNVHKASGLNARVLKECSNEISPKLALIYNESFALGDVPDEWRQANVSPVFKKGEKYDAANYRPVSLTCICCKTLEHILVSNINKHLALDSILADCQHGFRSQR